MMKCHYEVLSISRDANDGDIKTAYRKAALRWHPDKNLDDPDNAKEQFQLVQQAYEVLSDPQERAWYDRHREQILRKSHEKSFKDDSLDVFQYFTTSCFKGYGNDENGFYTVYRNVFQKIAAEDIEYLDSESDFEEIPLFGDSQSNYEDVVGPFYAHWMSYSTKKSFSWLDPFDILQAPDQRTAKMMEKANKKVRTKARKERNEEVRNLVAFVRKRDKRAQAYAQMLQNRALENRQKQENIRRQKLKEREQELSNAKERQQEWEKFENMQSELKEIEKSIAAEFGENLSDSDEDNCDSDSEHSHDDEDVSNLYCVACNKVFKTIKAFENHESSKKHRENVDKLKKEMHDEEEKSQNANENGDEKDEEIEIEKKHLNKSNLYCDVCNKNFKTIKAFENHELSEKHLENIEKDDEEVDLNETPVEAKKRDSDDDDDDVEKSKSKNRKKKSQVFEEVTVASDDDFDFGLSKKQKKKNQRNQSVINKQQSKPKDEADQKENPPTNIEPVNNQDKPAKKESIRKKSKKDLDRSEPVDLAHCCVTCKSNFPSKNKLFDHLKKTGHSIALTDKVNLANAPPKVNRKKKEKL